VGPGVDNDTRASSFNKDCLPLLPPRPPKPKNTYIHSSGIPPIATTPTKCTRAELKDPDGTAEKKAQAMQHHLDPLGELANMAQICLYQEHKGDSVQFPQKCHGLQCLAETKNFTAPNRTFLKKLHKHGMSVLLKTTLSTIAACNKAMQYRAHGSARDHKEFLCNKLADMVEAGHWLVLSYSTVRHTTGLQISPLGVVP
jgi:hypothetical protein